MAENEDIGFALNYTNILEIDITPNEPKHTWAWVAAGIKSIVPENSEVIAEDDYYDGEGLSSADVTGGKMGYAATGHRKMGDLAQDYVTSLSYIYGQARKTYFRRTSPDSEVIQGGCTLTDIIAGQGDATAKGDFSFKVKANGRPSIVPPSSTSLPASITVADIAVAVGNTETLAPTVQPTTASGKCLFAVEDDSIATVNADGVITGVAEGETKLTITAAAKPSVKAQITITVGVDEEDEEG